MGLALSILIGGRHSGGGAQDGSYPDDGSCESAKLEYGGRHDEWLDLIDNEEVLLKYGHAGVDAPPQSIVTSSLPLLMSSCGGESIHILRRDSGVGVTQGWTEQLSACPLQR